MTHAYSALLLALRPTPGAPARVRDALGRRGRVSRLADGAVPRSRDAHALWQVAAERGLRRPLRDPGVVSVTPGSARDEATLVVSEGDDRPVAVVQVMADRWHAERVEGEHALLDVLRRCVERDEFVLAALPEPPLYAGDIDGRQVVVERFEAVTERVGSGAAAQHIDLLARFQAITRRPQRPWTAADAQTVLSRSAEALALLPEGDAGPSLLERARAELATAVGAPCAMVAVHGDFRRGTLASTDAGVRLFGWGWSAATGHPAFDRWTYELDALAAAAGAADLDARVAASLATVTSDFERHGVDVRFARAMVLPVALELIARDPGRAGDQRQAACTVLAAIQRVLA